MNEPKTYHIRSGTLLPRIAVIAGAAMMVAGLYQLLFVNYLVGGLILLLGALGAFSRVGVIFEFDKDRFRNYTEVLFIKTGEWFKLSDFPDLVIIRKKLRANRNVGLVNFGSEVTTYYDLFLVNESHLKKVQIARFSSEEAAAEQAPIYAAQLKRNYTKFNPQISSSSRRRR